MPNFVSFELFQHAIPQKKAFFTYNSFSYKKVWFVWRKIEKKSIFSIFGSKLRMTTCPISNFSNMCKEISKMSPTKLVKRFEIKSHQSRALYYLYLAKNDESKTGSGDGRRPSLPFLGLSVFLLSTTIKTTHYGYPLKKQWIK